MDCSPLGFSVHGIFWAWILPFVFICILATSREDLTHWKRLWYCEGLGAGGEVDDRGWDGWMASRTRWTWVCVNSGSWWWTGRPGVLRFMGLRRVGLSDWTELMGMWTGLTEWRGVGRGAELRWGLSNRDCGQSQYRLPKSLPPTAVLRVKERR